MYWLVPPEWCGETVFILGGGPSLKNVDIFSLRNRRVIAINNSWELAPWADILYFCDVRWWNWHGERASRQFEGRYIVTASQLLDDPRGRLLKLTGATGLEKDPSGLRHGSNSGYQVINLAYHLGVKRIVLLGYDMHVKNGTHWHPGHPSTKPDMYGKSLSDAMLPKFDSLVDPLKEAGVEVINATPGSALRCWPIRSLKEAL